MTWDVTLIFLSFKYVSSISDTVYLHPILHRIFTTHEQSGYMALKGAFSCSHSREAAYKETDFKVVQGDIRDSNSVLYCIWYCFLLSHIYVEVYHKCSMQSDKSLAVENSGYYHFMCSFICTDVAHDDNID